MAGKKRIMAIPLLTLAALTPLLWSIEDTRAILWDVSWYTLTILMLIRPVANLTPKKWKLIRFLPYRKELGILSASVVVTNALYNFIPMGTGFFAHYFGEYWITTFPAVAGHLAELVVVPLLLTSNRHVQKRMKKWWKPVQRLSYLYFYGAGIFLNSIGKTDALISMIIVGTIATFAALKKRNRLWFKEK